VGYALAGCGKTQVSYRGIALAIPQEPLNQAFKQTKKSPERVRME